jgi:hypothetical protein
MSTSFLFFQFFLLTVDCCQCSWHGINQRTEGNPVFLTLADCLDVRVIALYQTQPVGIVSILIGGGVDKI